MTHITQETAVKLANKTGYAFHLGVPHPKVAEGLHLLCNAAIDHYLSTLSAELPEPVGYVYGVMTGGYVRRSMANINAGIELPSGEGLHTRDQLTQALATRDAKFKIAEETKAAMMKPIMEHYKTERDAALEKLEAEQALSAMRKGMVDGLLERRKLDEESMKRGDVGKAQK